MDDPSPPSLPVALPREVTQLRAGVNVLISVIIVVLAVINGFIITMIVPHMTKLFDDMIPGGVTRLPLITRLEIGMAGLYPSPQLILLGLVTGVLAAVWRLRSAFAAYGLGAALIGLLALHWMLVAYSCFAPLTAILGADSGR